MYWSVEGNKRSRFGFPELLAGAAGSRFPVLHFDRWHMHAFVTQLYGHKTFRVFAPDQMQYLYVREQYPQYISAIPNVIDVDPAEYLLFQQAKYEDLFLNP